MISLPEKTTASQPKTAQRSRKGKVTPPQAVTPLFAEDTMLPPLEAKEEKPKEIILEDDGHIETSDNSEISKMLDKARANARRRALIQGQSPETIAKDIRKQYPDIRDQSQKIADNAIEWARGHQRLCKVEVDGIPKTIVDMDFLDSQFAQLEAPGQPCVIIHRSDAQPISTKDFCQRLSGYVVITGVDDKGQTKYKAASAFWSGNTNKFIYKNIVFTNQPVGNDTYNLFTGFGVTPKEGECGKILNHIKEVICAGDEINYDAFIKLLAWQIQNIGEPSRIITALKSKTQQVGKGALLQDTMAVIYGDKAGLATRDIGQIITRFNDTIRGKAFVFLDEALFSGDRKSADAIKSLATTTKQPVESKGIPTVQFPIAVNLFLTTNHDDAAHIEESDARYWILEVSDHRFKDFAYFKELYAEIKDNGGRAAFMFHLLNTDVGTFSPARDVPMNNAAKNDMIRNSINAYDARKWLEACCYSEMLIGHKPSQKIDPSIQWELWREGAEYDNGIFYTAYAEWQRIIKAAVTPRPTPLNLFGQLLNNAGFSQRIESGARKRKLPNAEICLKTVTEMIDKPRK